MVFKLEKCEHLFNSIKLVSLGSTVFVLTLLVLANSPIVLANSPKKALLADRDITRQHAAGTTCPFSGGISRNPDGTYHFSLLHVVGGKIVDKNNCPVTLTGFNTFGTEFTDAMGGDHTSEFGDNPGGGMSLNRIKNLHQAFNMNFWRLAINVSWWNNNSYVPQAQMNYQDWIKQVITWMRDNGNYVEIDPVNYTTIAPGRVTDPYCATPPTPPCNIGQLTLNTPPWIEQQALDATTQFWQSIVPLYANDPAIVYDALNEPIDGGIPPGFPNYHADLNQMVTTIQHLNPNALVFVFVNNVSMQIIISGAVFDFPQQNLVYDYHVYDYPQQQNQPTSPPFWQQYLNVIQPQITWIQQHNHSVTIGEWGDQQLQNKVDFAHAIVNLVSTQGVATTCYADLATTVLGGQFSLSPLGVVVQREYASLPQLVSPITGTVTGPTTLQINTPGTFTAILTDNNTILKAMYLAVALKTNDPATSQNFSPIGQGNCTSTTCTLSVNWTSPKAGTYTVAEVGVDANNANCSGDPFYNYNSQNSVAFCGSYSYITTVISPITGKVTGPTTLPRRLFYLILLSSFLVFCAFLAFLTKLRHR